MVNDGRSSLQKAAALHSCSSALKIENRHISGGSNGKNNGTETSFEVSAPATRPPSDVARAAKTQSAFTIGESIAATSFVAKPHRTTDQTSKTKHFTIISAQDVRQGGSLESDMDIDHHFEVSLSSMDVKDTTFEMLENRQPSIPTAAKTQTFLQIGDYQVERMTNNAKNVSLGCNDEIDDRSLEQMKGVIDQGSKMPLVVIDGANVAYAYSSVKAGMYRPTPEIYSSVNSKSKLEPDVRGIQIASDYFLEKSIRVLVVLPQYFFGRNDNKNYAKSTTMTLIPQSEILSDLKERGLIVASPATDDDDAYALTIASREENRSCKPPRNGEGPGFVLSNDLFRDAQKRDSLNGTLKTWLTKGRNSDIGPGRISYTFGDMGSLNDRGERIFDFVPNPKHPLVVWMEKHE
mmetsp:Transcript_6976/g.17064  ORF Transcript_6976/g.17064 Transcript_6976/m.17064 type:complete len:406 (-) Transcript_6976:182-1399(-)